MRVEGFSLVQGGNLRQEHQIPVHFTKQLVLDNMALTSLLTGSSSRTEGSRGDMGSSWLNRVTDANLLRRALN